MRKFIVSAVLLLVGLPLMHLLFSAWYGSSILLPQQSPNSKVAIVLGASVKSDGTLSGVLRDRADTAFELYQSGKVERILISGDNRSHDYNEVVPVKQYLIGRGIPSQYIYLDYAGFDTYSSMYRARDVFLVTDALIVTQKFHLPRALFLANSLKIRASGVVADRNHYPRLWYFYLREIPALIKAIYEVVTGAKPRHLGDTVDVFGEPQPFGLKDITEKS